MYGTSELALVRSADPSVTLPGVDTTVGNTLAASSLTQLSSISTNSSDPIWYDAAANVVYVKQAGAVLSGYNFGTANVFLMANNVTIENSSFSAGNQYYSVQEKEGVTGAVINSCTFDGGSGTTDYPMMAWIAGNGLTVENSKFLNTPGWGIDIGSGSVSNNYFSGAGYSSTGIHADAVYVSGNSGAVTISGNFIDWTDGGTGTTNSGGTTDSNGGTNEAIRISTDFGNTSNVTVTNNVLLGGTYTVFAANTNAGVLSNINIANNYIGFGNAGQFYPGAPAGVSLSNNVVFDYTNPSYSANAWATYLAAGLQTTHLVVSNNAAYITGAATGSTTLYGNGTSEVLCGTSNETVFVGGAGVQWLWGGTGQNIAKYLAISDSTPDAADSIGNFNWNKDVIDLSSINANPGSATVENFTFIGSNAFTSSGAEVRVVQDVANDQTLVEATLAGDITPDLEIRVGGLVTLTAANFALTAAESQAAITNGAAAIEAMIASSGSSGTAVVNNSSASSTTPLTSAGAWSAYLAAGLQTNNLVISSNAQYIKGDATGSSTLYGNGTREVMCGTSNETIFVGGADVQWLWGGSGENIAKYLAVTDSTTVAPDSIGNFDWNKDIIDLSAIDANPSVAGVQNFTFIGSSAFTSAGAEVRVVQDVANDQTLVEATLAGDTAPDLEIRVGGLVNLTADDFALTAAQSQAAVSAGTALQLNTTYSSGSEFENSYTNVLNKSYTSFEEVYSAPNTLVADAYNYSNGGDSIILLGNTLTYSDGGVAESIKTGAATFSIGHHSSETIDATSSTGDTFSFHSGFGSATLTGLTNQDVLQLDKSMFSYMTSSMTQAQDLAALIGHATTSASGLVITDATGDQLKLSGVLASALSANPGQVRFA